MKPFHLTLLVLTMLGIICGCTVIAWNSGPVSTTEKDSHKAKGTNVKTFDTTLSPK